MIRRGLPSDALDLARHLHQHRLAHNGPDDSRTLDAVVTLAAVLSETGIYSEARDLKQDTLTRQRRVLGDDHPATLNSASNLAADLRALGEAPDGAGA